MIAEIFILAASEAREQGGISLVAMSGNWGQGRRLTSLLRCGRAKTGFKVFQHRQVSPGDRGLSYGQAAVTAAILKRK